MGHVVVVISHLHGIHLWGCLSTDHAYVGMRHRWSGLPGWVFIMRGLNRLADTQQYAC